MGEGPSGIDRLIADLSFIRDKKRWGYPFRFGHFQVSGEDFGLIARACCPIGANMMREIPWSLESPEDSPGFMLWRVANAWQRNLRAVLEPLGLTHVQFVLLANLGWMQDQGQSPTQAELAAQCGADKMMTSQVLRSLESAGLVERRPHPDDSRARQLALTPEGRDVLAKALPLVEAADREFFGRAGKLPDIAGLLRRLQA